MAEAGLTADATTQSGQATEGAAVPGVPRRINMAALAVGAGIAVAIAAAVFLTFYFTGKEFERDVQAWQVRLGIVADSRAAAVNDWVEENFAHMRELAQNASLQLYLSELAFAEEDAETGAAKDKGKDTDVDEESPAEASYLRNLLVATAERTGFKAPPPVGEVAANVEVLGVAGIGLVDAEGRTLVSTRDMPPLSKRIRQAIAAALEGEPAFIDAYVGPAGEPTVGFALPIYGIQDEGEGEGAKGIGAVIGIRTLGRDLYERLIQPGAIEETAETYIIRRRGGSVEYLSPLADGTPPLKRSLAADTAELAAGFSLEKPGGFAFKRDYAGTDVLVTSRALADVPWVIVRKISRDEALAEADARRTTLLGVFGSIITIVTFAILFVWKRGASVRATQALHEARIALDRFQNMSKFMRVVTDSQPTQVVAVDGATQYTFANEPAARAAGIAVEDMVGKTMASVIGPIKAHVYEEINTSVLKTFDPESHMRVFGEEGEDGFQVVKSDHVPLRGDRDYPPGVLMVLDDITELTHERRRNERMMRELIDTLVSVVDRRDPFSANHSARVAEVARCVAEEMDCSEVEVKTVDIAGSLMNLGKIFIPPDLLTKSGDLSREERELIANSYLVSVDLLEGVSFDGPVVETIRELGETWNGSGPLGLKEEEILRTARILAVANTFVGMISPRAYRDAMTFERASDILMEETRSKFDRKAVTALVNFLENRDGSGRWAHFRRRPRTAADAEAAIPPGPPREELVDD